MASADREMARVAQRVAEIVAENPNLVEQVLGMIRTVEERPVSSTIRRFIDEQGERFCRELSLLARFNRPVIRLMVYGREVKEEGAKDSGEADWSCSGAYYAAPEFFREGIDDLRQAMSKAVQAAESKEAVSLWLPAIETPGERDGFLIFMRDQDGNEALFAAVMGEVRRIPADEAHLADIINGMTQPVAKRRVQPYERLEAELGSTATWKAVQTAMKEAGQRAVTQKQWSLIAGWVAHSEPVRDEMIDYAGRHASRWGNEAQELLHVTVHSISEMADRFRSDHEKALANIERQQDKKLHRLRSDVEKMRILTDGVKKRADRADADNRALRKQLNDALASQGASPEGAGPGGDEGAVNGNSSLGQALDALFV